MRSPHERAGFLFLRFLWGSSRQGGNAFRAAPRRTALERAVS